jgi:hypothetical protein
MPNAIWEAEMDDRLLVERLIEEVEERVKAEAKAKDALAMLHEKDRQIYELLGKNESLTKNAEAREQSLKEARAERDSVHAMHAKVFRALDEIRQVSTNYLLQVHEHPKSGFAERVVLEERLRTQIAAARAIYDAEIPF